MRFSTPTSSRRRNIGDPKVLAEIAAQCGVKGWPASRRRTCRELEEEVRGLGISGVPTFIFERRHGVSGAYPAESLAEVIRQAAMAQTVYSSRCRMPVLREVQPRLQHHAVDRQRRALAAELEHRQLFRPQRLHRRAERPRSRRAR